MTERLADGSDSTQVSDAQRLKTALNGLIAAANRGLLTRNTRDKEIQPQPDKVVDITDQSTSEKHQLEPAE